MIECFIFQIWSVGKTKWLVSASVCICILLVRPIRPICPIHPIIFLAVARLSIINLYLSTTPHRDLTDPSTRDENEICKSKPYIIHRTIVNNVTPDREIEYKIPHNLEFLEQLGHL